MPEPITDDQRDLASEVREALAKAAEAQRRIEADKGRLRIGASHDAARRAPDVRPVHRPQPQGLHPASLQRSPLALRLRRERTPREAA